MAGYLLSTKALYEFVSGAASPCAKFQQWLSGLSQADELYASEISLGELRTSIEAVSDLRIRNDWRLLIEGEIPRDFGARLLQFTGVAVEEWGLIRMSGDPSLPAEETMIIGQAIANELPLIGPETPAHRTVGIRIIDPYRGDDWPGEIF